MFVTFKGDVVKAPREYDSTHKNFRYINQVFVRKGVVEMLRNLREKVDAIYLFSAGYCDYVTNAAKMTGIDKYVDGIFSDAHTVYLDGTGACHGNRHKCVEQLCTTSGKPLKECDIVFVDDTPSAIHACPDVNMKVCVVGRYCGPNAASDDVSAMTALIETHLSMI